MIGVPTIKLLVELFKPWWIDYNNSLLCLNLLKNIRYYYVFILLYTAILL